MPIKCLKCKSNHTYLIPIMNVEIRDFESSSYLQLALSRGSTHIILCMRCGQRKDIVLPKTEHNLIPMPSSTISNLEDEFVTKDSGSRETWNTGAKRDVQKNKPRYDLISRHSLKRLANLLSRGAKKYGERNWEKGMPLSRFYSSALRHLIDSVDSKNRNDREDHLAAVLFNVSAIIHFIEERKIYGKDYLPDIYDVDFE